MGTIGRMLRSLVGRRRKSTMPPPLEGRAGEEYVDGRIREVSAVLDDIAKRTGECFVVLHSSVAKDLSRSSSWAGARDRLVARAAMHGEYVRRFYNGTKGQQG